MFTDKASEIHTLILGGGFAGLFTAVHLNRQHYRLPIILIDQQDRFVFKPLLYELLSNEMSLDLTCPRYDDLLYNSGIVFIRDTVQAIELENQQVRLKSGLYYSYQHLVLTLGSTSNFSDVEGAEYSLPFRTGEDAKPFVENSPFMSWMYSVWSVQGASNVIGVIEVAAAVLMAARPWSALASAIGSAMAVITFVLTLSFLFSTPPVLQRGLGFPYLSPAPGQFLLKDIVLLGGAVWSLGESLKAMNGIRNGNRL